MQQVIPIPTLHLFPVLDELLIGLLKSLSADDWNKPTVARLWTVKDIAAHLLDTNVRTIILRTWLRSGNCQTNKQLSGPCSLFKRTERNLG